MRTLIEITKESFDAILQLRAIDDPVAQPEALQNQVRGYIDSAIRAAQDEGHSKRDVQDMAYALISLADEIAGTKPAPLGRFWVEHSLQLSYFRENVAGDEFFRRLQSIRSDKRRQEVLAIYFLCLLFGFQGHYGAGGNQSELLTLMDSVKKELRSGEDDTAPLSPRGDRPDEAVKSSRGISPIILGGVLVLLAFIGVFIGLRVSLNNEVAKALQKLEPPTSLRNR